MMTISVPPAALPYLRLQKGSLDPDLPLTIYLARYSVAIQDDFDDLVQFLPLSCQAILDIGGGLGGVDILLARYYEQGGPRGAEGPQGKQPVVCILDGEADPPRMTLHRQTFNHMGVTQEFLQANGVKRFRYIVPEHARLSPMRDVPLKPDLVISLGSWGFHYPPEVYQAFVAASLKRNSVVVLDVRRGKDHWEQSLSDAFRRKFAVIREGRKFRRLVWLPGTQDKAPRAAP